MEVVGRCWAVCSVVALLLVSIVFLSSATASGSAKNSGVPRSVSLEDFDVRGPWQLTGLSIEGLGILQDWTIQSSLQTQARPWWAFWRPRPTFVPGYLYDDLELIRGRLRAAGYYEVRVRESLVIQRDPGVPATPSGEGTPGEVYVQLDVEPGRPIVVCSLYIDLDSVTFPEGSELALQRRFPLKLGDVFTRGAYQEAATRYEDYLALHGYPDAEVSRHARVDVQSRCAQVAYGLELGDFAVFGVTQIQGLETLPENLVRREITYREGEAWDAEELRQTRANLRDTRLFSLIRIRPKPMADGEVRTGEAVPVDIEVSEGPTHEVRLGVGYGTEDGFRGVASWWNYNFLGGNRRLGLSTKISQINRWVDASLSQPHFPFHRSTTSISFTLGQQRESTYRDDSVLTTPKVGWWFDENLTATTYFVFRYDSLSEVSAATIEDLGPPDQFQDSGFTNTFGLGARWIDFDDPANPTSGLGLSVASEISGGILGGDFNLFRLIAQGAYYQPLFADLVLGVELRGATVVPYDGTPQVPLWARLYAGGNASFPVRGYARRRVGPLSGSDDPLGGRTAVVGSLELIYPIVEPVFGVLFVDAGDVELSSWTFDPANVQTGVGVGVRAATPVGPVELDFGFGLDHPSDDSVFQVYFSIGPRF